MSPREEATVPFDDNSICHVNHLLTRVEEETFRYETEEIPRMEESSGNRDTGTDCLWGSKCYYAHVGCCPETRCFQEDVVLTHEDVHEVSNLRQLPQTL